jgi:hypothetical protein
VISDGGADQDRTDDLLNAIQALSQLSYSPIKGVMFIANGLGGVNSFFPIKTFIFFLDLKTGILYTPVTFCRSGEIGRRTGLKIQRGQPRVGSTPTSGTTKESTGWPVLG